MATDKSIFPRFKDVGFLLKTSQFPLLHSPHENWSCSPLTTLPTLGLQSSKTLV